MLIKRILTFASVGLAALSVGSAIAGGPDMGDETPAPTYAGVYVEGNLGYVHRDWESFASNLVFNTSTGNSNRTGGFTFGFDLGYRFNRYWALEGGWYYLPKVSGTVTNANVGPAVGTGVNIKGWLAYGAIKLMAPVYDNAYFYGKFGGVYTNNTASTGIVPTNTSANNVTKSKYWNPMFAVGADYYCTPNVLFNIQYMFVSGYERVSNNRFGVPSASIITVGVGYTFLM